MVTIHKAFFYELEPTKEQAIMLARIAGSCRYVYNWGLALIEAAIAAKEKVPTFFDLANKLPELKRAVLTLWLAECPSQTLQQVLKDLEAGFKHFFRRINNKEKPGFPRYKKKGKKCSFRYPQGVECKEGKVKAPKIGWIKYKNSRPLEGIIKQATVKWIAGRWFISILCEIKKEISLAPFNEERAVGIDVGLLSFATLSDGQAIPNPHFLKKDLRQLKKLQKKMSKMKKGGSNRKKVQAKINKLHWRISNKRKDYLQKWSTILVKNHDIIVVESLNIKGMMKNRHLSQAIADVGWYTFMSYLEYKCTWYGKHFVPIPRFTPTSKVCSNCNSKQDMPLGVRTFNCTNCGMSLNRDHNAAINIKAAGLSVLQTKFANACGGTNGGPNEAGIRRFQAA